MEKRLRECDKHYYLGTKSLLSDKEYDKLMEEYEELYGEYIPDVMDDMVEFEHMKCVLPIPSPSLNKITEERKFNNYKKGHEGDFVVMDKVDGMSLIMYYKEQRVLTHCTDGIHGRDVSYMWDFIKKPDVTEDLIVRVEFVMKNEIFQRKYKEMYNDPRTMISGIVNKKVMNREMIGDASVIAYEIQNLKIPIKEQLEILERWGFELPNPEIYGNDLDFITVAQKITNDKTEYNIDGKVVAKNIYEEPIPGKNPSYKIAVKIRGEMVETTVVMVEWNESRLRKMKPRVNIESVFLDGGNLSWASGHNGRYIKDNNVGAGSKVLVTRSGTIIPYIIKVIEGTVPDLPTTDCVWGDSGVELYCSVNDKVLTKRLEYFFEVLEAKFLGLKTIEKIYNAGFKTLDSILSITIDDLLSIPCIKNAGATRIFNSIRDCVKNITMVNVMVGSSFFPGFGKGKIQPIFDGIPNLTQMILDGTYDSLSLKDLHGIRGIKGMAEVFVDSLDAFKEFLDTNKTLFDLLTSQEHSEFEIEVTDLRGPICTNSDIITPSILLPSIVIPSADQVLKGMVIVFSGDKKLKNKAIQMGATVEMNYTKRTTLLVVGQLNSGNSKEALALKNGTPVMALKEFKQMYNID